MDIFRIIQGFFIDLDTWTPPLHSKSECLVGDWGNYTLKESRNLNSRSHPQILLTTVNFDCFKILFSSWTLTENTHFEAFECVLMSWDRVIPQSYQNRNFLESQGNKHEQTGQEIRAGGSVSSTHLLHTRGTHRVKTAFLTQPLIFTLSEAYNQSLCVPNRNLNQAISFIFWRKEESISLIHIFKHEERLDLELVGQSGRQTFSGRTHECVWVTHTISLSCSLETRGSPKADLKLHFWVILYTDTVSFPLLFLLPNTFAITWFFDSHEGPWNILGGRGFGRFS